jgi:hypothetical protein
MQRKAQERVMMNQVLKRLAFFILQIEPIIGEISIQQSRSLRKKNQSRHFLLLIIKSSKWSRARNHKQAIWERNIKIIIIIIHRYQLRK